MLGMQQLRRGAVSLSAIALALAGVAVGTSQTAVANTETTTEATAQWGVKESFRKYIAGNIARGSVDFTGNVSDAPAPYTWTDGTGTVDRETGAADISFEGSVTFNGHHGLLETKLSDLRVVINADSSGAIYADVSAKQLDSEEIFTADDVAFATIQNPTWTDTEVSGSAVLTESGAQAFAGFYEPGVELDDISLTIPEPAPAPTEDETTEPTEEPEAPESPETTEPTGEPEASEPTETTKPVETSTPKPSDSAAPKPSETAKPEKPTKTTAPKAPEADSKPASPQAPATTEDTCVANEVSGTMNWGVRTSFRNYIQGGIAKGSWTLDGVAESANGFTWNGSGEINTETMSGTVHFPGSVHFTGHKGILDLKFSNIRVVFNSANSGALVMDVNYSDMEGNKGSASNVAFADLSFGGVQAQGGRIEVSNAAATLTADGAVAFAGFYEAGTELDPISLSLELGGETSCSAAAGTTSDAAGGGGKAGGSKKGGKLAETGASGEFAPFMAGAAALILLGAAALTRVRSDREALAQSE